MYAAPAQTKICKNLSIFASKIFTPLWVPLYIQTPFDEVFGPQKTCPKKTKLEHVFGRPGYMTPFLGCFFSAVQTLATHFGFRRCVFRKTPRDVLLFKVLANEAPQGHKLGHDLKVLRKKPSKRVADLAPEARPKTLVKHQHLDPDLYHLSADMCPAKLFWGDKSAVFLPVGDMELINGELCFSYHGNPMVHWWMNSEGIRTRNSRQHGAYSQLMVDWWFGARWFGIRFGIFPSNNPFHKGDPKIANPPGPKPQFNDPFDLPPTRNRGK